MDIGEYIKGITKKSKDASIGLRGVIPEMKNRALKAIANSLQKESKKIKEANIIDYEKGKKKGLSEAFLDRLLLTDERIDNMIHSVNEIIALKDPVGEVIAVRRPKGFILEKVSIPIGVVAVIYESRPNVTVDAASLCLKSSNACILRGGSESLESNRMLVRIIQKALDQSGLGKDTVLYIERVEHEGVKHLVKQEGLVDLVIPRGGESLTRMVTEEAMVPVIKHYKGVCHLFVDTDADLDMAVKVVQNAKVQRPGTCNALETLLVHSDIKNKFLPMIREALEGVELRGCSRTNKILPDIEQASEDDYYTEYLGLILAIKIVDSVDEAISHIEQYGSSHTDGIISRNIHNIKEFTDTVDSAVVTVNASTRLSDGGVFGLGAEIGISTDKLHARGPMGIGELVTYKWVIRGDGHIR
jgi:glutamate-5-semialdehyde dehydrogenase